MIMPELQTDVFACDFARRNLILPKVHTLVVGPFCDFTVKMCPNVRTIASSGYSWLHSRRAHWQEREHTADLIIAAGTARHLTNLCIEDHMHPQLVTAIADTLPGLQSLIMDGGIRNTPLAQFVPALSQMLNLKRLVLAMASELGVGFDPPECGNAYMDANDNVIPEIVAYYDAQQYEAETKVLLMIAPVCRRLQELWIGERSRADIMRDSESVYVNAAWCRDQAIEKVALYPPP